MYGILPQQVFFVAAVVYSGLWDFLYGRCKELFVSELNNAYFPDIYFKTVFEWLSLASQFASLTRSLRMTIF